MIYLDIRFQSSDQMKYKSQVETFKLIKELGLPCQSHNAIIDKYESKSELSKFQVSCFIDNLKFEQSNIIMTLKHFESEFL